MQFGGENWRKKGSNRLFDIALYSLFVDRGVIGKPFKILVRLPCVVFDNLVFWFFRGSAHKTQKRVNTCCWCSFFSRFVLDLLVVVFEVQRGGLELVWAMFSHAF